MSTVYDDGRATLRLGNALALLSNLPDGAVDAVIADPPYSSGGAMRSDRTGSSSRTKYTSSDAQHTLEAFSGDNRDQRGYRYWSALWLAEALRVTRTGGVCIVWTDWRQLPVTTDAIQAGGWVWRGIVPWSKVNYRPQMGRFGAACEYVVWGSNGPMSERTDVGCLPGFYEAMPPRDRVHITQKPLDVMRGMVRICPPGGLVLDPFAGSCTTGVAALIEGRRFLGFEHDRTIAAVGAERLATAAMQPKDDQLELLADLPP